MPKVRAQAADKVVMTLKQGTGAAPAHGAGRQRRRTLELPIIDYHKLADVLLRKEPSLAGFVAARDGVDCERPSSVWDIEAWTSS